MKKIKNNFFKTLLVGLLLTAGFSDCVAQASFSIGPKAGASLTKYVNSDIARRTENGFVGGIFANFTMLNLVTIQPELLYHDNSARVAATNQLVRMNFIEVPVLLKFGFPVGGPIMPHVFAGPSFAWRTSGRTLVTTDDGAQMTFGMDRTRTNGIVGAGLDFGMRRTFINLDARYAFGLNNRPGDDMNINVNTRNVIFMAGIGYRIGR
ncbi:MAG: porin family protein [Cytophagaceae bacterium]